MCECLERIEKTLTEKMLEMNPDCEVVDNVELQNVTFLMPSCDRVPYNPVLGKYKKGNKTMKFDTLKGWNHKQFKPYTINHTP